MARSQSPHLPPPVTGDGTRAYLDIHEFSARTGLSLATIHR